MKRQRVDFIGQGLSESIAASASRGPSPGRKRLGTPAALLLCDLDHFKRLNDSYGHATGDQALIAFGQVMTEKLRKQDVFARIGGEEFACLLMDVDESAAAEVAERIRLGFAGLALLPPGLLSVSIGVVTTLGEPGYELSRLLTMADEALYTAKRCGRNRVQVASVLGHETSGRTLSRSLK